MVEAKPERASEAVASRGALAFDTQRSPAERLAGALPSGRVIDEKYRVERLLACGHTGVIVAAMHLRLSERVALKLLASPVDERDSSGALARFRREARISAQLKNEHVARVLDVGELAHGDATVPYLVMELLEGEDVGALIAAHGALSIESAVEYVVQACEGLAEAHGRGIVHRDLEPSNLFVAHRSGGLPLVKLLDFGTSKWAEGGVDAGLTSAGAQLGTPGFAAPELLEDAGNVDARADVWSIAAILFAMLTGLAPRRTEDFAELGEHRPAPALTTLRPEAPAALSDAVARALERDRGLRTPDVATFAHAVLVAIGSARAEPVHRALRAMLDGPLLPASPTAARLAAGTAAERSTNRVATLHLASAEVAAEVTLDAPPSAAVRSSPAFAATSSRPAARSRRAWIPPLVAVTLVGGVAIYAASRPDRGASNAVTPASSLASGASGAGGADSVSGATSGSAAPTRTSSSFLKTSSSALAPATGVASASAAGSKSVDGGPPPRPAGDPEPDALRARPPATPTTTINPLEDRR
jgi:serine/threonine-protein kinase